MLSWIIAYQYVPHACVQLWACVFFLPENGEADGCSLFFPFEAARGNMATSKRVPLKFSLCALCFCVACAAALFSARYALHVLPRLCACVEYFFEIDLDVFPFPQDLSTTKSRIKQMEKQHRFCFFHFQI